MRNALLTVAVVLAALAVIWAVFPSNGLGTAPPHDPLAILGPPTKVRVHGKVTTYYEKIAGPYLELCERWIYAKPGATYPWKTIERCLILGVFRTRKSPAASLNGPPA